MKALFRLASLNLVLLVFSLGCESTDSTGTPIAPNPKTDITSQSDSALSDTGQSSGNDASVPQDATMPAGTDTQATQDSASVDSTSDSATPTDTFEDAGDSPALVDVGEPTDAGDDEDVSAVVFDDGLTIPAPGEAACDNKDDIVIIANGQDALTEVMKNCALNCLGEELCATDCVTKDLGVSAECAGCFGSNIACTMKNCALQCLNADDPNCLECQEKHCMDAFEVCAGIEIPGS